MLKLIFEIKYLFYLFYFTAFIFCNGVINILLFYPLGITLSIVLLLFLYFAFYIYLNALCYQMLLMEHYIDLISHLSFFFSFIYRYINFMPKLLTSIIYFFLYNISLYNLVFKINYLLFRLSVILFIISYI